MKAKAPAVHRVQPAAPYGFQPCAGTPPPEIPHSTPPPEIDTTPPPLEDPVYQMDPHQDIIVGFAQLCGRIEQLEHTLTTFQGQMTLLHDQVAYLQTAAAMSNQAPQHASQSSTSDEEASEWTDVPDVPGIANAGGSAPSCWDGGNACKTSRPCLGMFFSFKSWSPGLEDQVTSELSCHPFLCRDFILQSNLCKIQIYVGHLIRHASIIPAAAMAPASTAHWKHLYGFWPQLSNRLLLHSGGSQPHLGQWLEVSGLWNVGTPNQYRTALHLGLL